MAVRGSTRVWRSETRATGRCACTSHLEATFRRGNLVELARRHDWDCPVASVPLDPRQFVLRGVEVALP